MRPSINDVLRLIGCNHSPLKDVKFSANIKYFFTVDMFILSNFWACEYVSNNFTYIRLMDNHNCQNS